MKKNSLLTCFASVLTIITFTSSIVLGDTIVGGAKGSPSDTSITLGGTVVGPGASTDDHIARWDGNLGTMIQNSPVKILDSGDTSGVFSLQLDQTSGSVITGSTILDATVDGTFRLRDSTSTNITTFTLGTDLLTINDSITTTGDITINGGDITASSTAPTVKMLDTDALAHDARWLLDGNALALAFDTDGDGLYETTTLTVASSGKVTIPGLLDPTGLVMTEQASVPGGAPAAGSATLWVENITPNALRFTNDAGTNYAVFQSPAVASLDMDGQDIILDADGDSRLELGTNDSIGVFLGGLLDFTVSANTFQLETGSVLQSAGTNVVVNDSVDIQGGTVTNSTGALSLTTASNGNISLTPNGTGGVSVVTGGTTADGIVNIQANSVTSGSVFRAASTSTSILGYEVGSFTRGATASGEGSALQIRDNSTSTDALSSALQVAGGTEDGSSKLWVMIDDLDTPTVVSTLDTLGNATFFGGVSVGTTTETTAGNFKAGSSVNNGFYLGQDTDMYFIDDGTNTVLNFDANDFVGYVRSTDTLNFSVAAATRAALTSTELTLNGKLAVNGDEITSDGTTLIINANGAVDIQDNVTVGGSLTVTSAVTTSNAATITADNLTTGEALKVTSNTADTGVHSVVEIINDNTLATGTTALRVQQDSTGFAIDAQGNVNIAGKLTVSGLIDPTGLVLDEQVSVPGGNPGAGKSTIWVDSTTGVLKVTEQGGATQELASTAGSSDIVITDATNDGNPFFAAGSSSTERFEIKALYDSLAQTFDAMQIRTKAASAVADKGRIEFYPDEALHASVDDSGIDLPAADKLLWTSRSFLSSDNDGAVKLATNDGTTATTTLTTGASGLTIGDAVITTGNIDVQGGTVTNSTGALSLTTAASGNLSLLPNGTGDVLVTGDNWTVDGSGNAVIDGTLAVNGDAITSDGTNFDIHNESSGTDTLTLGGGAGTGIVTVGSATRNVSIPGTLSSGSPFTISSTAPALRLTDTTATSDDTQWLMDGNLLTLGFDTDDNGTYDVTSVTIASGTGNVTLNGDLAVNGDDITSDGATLTINADGVVDIQDDLVLTGGDIDVRGGDIRNTTGALTMTPASGSSLSVVLATTGDFIVNTDDLFVDSSAQRVGINNATPTVALDVTGDAKTSGDVTVSGGDVFSGAAVNSTLFSDTTTATIDLASGLTNGAMTVGTASGTSTLLVGGGAGTGLVTVGSTTRNVSVPGTLLTGSPLTVSAAAPALRLTDTTALEDDAQWSQDANALTLAFDTADDGIYEVTALTIASATGNATLTGTLAVNGDTITADGATLTVNAGGTVAIQDNITSTNKITAGANTNDGFYLGQDVDMYFIDDATNTVLAFDANDFISYARATNVMSFSIGTAQATLSSTALTLTGDLAVNGDDITSDGATLTINAAGTVAIQDNVTMTGTADVQGATVTNSTGALSLTTAASGNLSLLPNGTGDVLVTGDNWTMDGSGNAVLDGTLAVNGDTITADGATLTINAGGTVDVQDHLTVTGNFTDTSTATTADAATITANSLTTGEGLKVTSDSADIGVRSIVEIINDNALATGATALRVQQDSTGYAIDATGNVRVTGKLTVTGLIDPTGLVLDEQATVPGGAPAAAKGTLWVKNTTPNTLYFTNDVGTDFNISGAALAGADTQVIFNDGGTSFAGDAGFTFNKTTDALTLAGALAVNGDSITADGATLTINAGGTVLIQDNITTTGIIDTQIGSLTNSTGALSLTTASNGDVTLAPNGTGDIILSTDADTEVLATPSTTATSGALVMSASSAGAQVIGTRTANAGTTASSDALNVLYNAGGVGVQTHAFTRYVNDEDNESWAAGVVFDAASGDGISNYVWKFSATETATPSTYGMLLDETANLTVGAKVTAGSATNNGFYLGQDTDMYFIDDSVNTILAFDANDYIGYARGTDTLAFNVAAASRATITSSGLSVSQGLSANIVGGAGDRSVCMTNGNGQFSQFSGTCGTSSKRFKHAIRNATLDVDTAYKLRPVDYVDNGDKTERVHLGLIAEEVEQVAPEIVGYENDGVTPHNVSYDRVGVIAIMALQKLKPVIDAAIARIDALYDSDHEQDERIAELEARLIALDAKFNAHDCAARH